MSKEDKYMTPEIEIALNECRQAWSEFFIKNELSPDSIRFKDGTPIYAWCLHHEKELETLYVPIENIIRYILEHKREEELELRFINLRPLSIESNKALAPAWKKHYKTLDEANAQYRKIREAAQDKYKKIREEAEEYDKAEVEAWGEYIKDIAPAKAKYYKSEDEAWNEVKKVISIYHLMDVPNNTWNGKSIFKENVK